MLLKNQKGQTLIEALFAGAAAVLSFGLLLMMLYRGVVYFGARYCINELLFCLSSLTSQGVCESEFKNRTQKLLVFKETSKLEVRKTKSEIWVGFFIEAPGTPAMSLQRKLHLPLKRNF
jgi:hypothetical protein